MGRYGLGVRDIFPEVGFQLDLEGGREREGNRGFRTGGNIRAKARRGI